MTVAELYQAVADGGSRTAAFVIATPLVLGGISLLLRDNGHPKTSQTIANLSIVIALLALSIEVFALVYAVQEYHISPLADVSIWLLLAPVYLLGAALVIEHLIHPGRQHGVRKKIRAGVLAVITLAVVFFILGKLRLYMVIWTSMTGFLLFVVVLIALFYFMVRKFI